MFAAESKYFTMAYIEDKYTEQDYFEYVMRLKYSEAIDLLRFIGKENNLNIHTSDGFIKGMTIYAGITQRMNQQLLQAGLHLNIK